MTRFKIYSDEIMIASNAGSKDINKICEGLNNCKVVPFEADPLTYGRKKYTYL